MASMIAETLFVIRGACYPFGVFAAMVLTVVAIGSDPSPAAAQSRGLGDLGAGSARPERSGGIQVDVELVLAVDVSWSMSDVEQIIQRNGYAAAFRSRDVQEAIANGVHGAIAVTYVEWAGEASQRVVVPWTMVDTKVSADEFAYALASEPPSRRRRTSISAGIAYSATLFEENGYGGLKRVIDVSGDGPNNQGPQVTLARDEAVARGIVINGLPLMTTDRAASWARVDDLDQYYEACVVGGQGSFVIPVNDWSQFPQAVRRKLVLELALAPPLETDPGRWDDAQQPVIRTMAQAPVDCLIGERQWQDRQRRWLEDIQ